MSKAGGLLLKSSSALIRFLQFLSAALILGIFSYFLAYLHHHHRHIPTWMRAVEGMSGVAALYAAIALLLVCFLGGITFFAFLGLLLDLAFIGAFIAIAVLTRGGAKKCNGARSPLGNNRVRDCRFERGAFAVAVVAAFLFLLSAISAFLLNRHHKKEKKFGPSPANNYTSGSGKRQPFWKRKNRKQARDVELGTTGAVGAGAVVAEEKHRHNHHNNTVRPSHDTGMTGSTAAPLDNSYGGPNNKYGDSTLPVSSSNYSSPQNPSSGNTYNAAPVSGHGTTNYQVIHDSTPYAGVHHGGHVHTYQDSGTVPQNY